MWKVVWVDPRKTVVGPNIRLRNDRHIWNLAKSMRSDVGQIEECVGEMFKGEVRIWAGIHRRNAAVLICKRWNPAFRLRVRVSTKPLTAAQIITIQLAENLHHQMSPAEEAEGIEKLYRLIVQLEGKAPSKVGLSRQIGRGVAKVRSALKFVSLRPAIRRMVRLGLLNYGVAVEMAALPTEKQTKAAEHIILTNMRTLEAIRYVRQTVGGGGGQIGLFAGQMEIEITEQNFRLAFRNAFDHAADDAAGYFERVLWYLNRFATKEKRVEMTTKIVDILVTFVESSDEFKRLLAEAEPKLARELLMKKKRLSRGL